MKKMEKDLGRIQKFIVSPIWWDFGWWVTIEELIRISLEVAFLNSIHALSKCLYPHEIAEMVEEAFQTNKPVLLFNEILWE